MFYKYKNTVIQVTQAIKDGKRIYYVSLNGKKLTYTASKSLAYRIVMDFIQRSLIADEAAEQSKLDTDASLRHPPKS